MTPKGKVGLPGLVILAGLLFTGCATQILAKKIVQAPNRSGLKSEGLTSQELKKTGAAPWTQAWRLQVGPPTAELQVAVVEPGDYHLKHELKIETDAAEKSRTLKLSVRWDTRDVTRAELKGTLLLLHGIYVSKERMLHWAMYLAKAGYRCVLVDQRGHGESTGKWITYGAVEAKDMSQVLNELQRRGLMTEQVGVLGLSYGASVGLLLAAQDERVRTVVALAPFCDAREAIPEYARANLGSVARKFSDNDFDRALDKAQKFAAFSWQDDDVKKAIGRTKAAVLFYHGAQDDWLAPRHSRELMARAPKGSRLVILPEDNHTTLSIRLDPIATDVAAWFDQHLAKASAPKS